LENILKSVFGVITGLLTIYCFYNALLNTVPGYNSHAIGSNLGTHFVWIIFAIITYFLFRKKFKKTKFDFIVELIINPKNNDEKFYRNKILVICSGIIVFGYAFIFDVWLMPSLILLYLTYLYFEQY